MKLHAPKFGLAAASIMSFLTFLQFMFWKVTCMRAPAEAQAAFQKMAQMQMPQFHCPWSQILLGTVQTFIAVFVATWFFAWFYNKLIS